MNSTGEATRLLADDAPPGMDTAYEVGHDLSEAQSAAQTTAAQRIRIVRLPTQMSQVELIVPYALVAEITEVILPEGETHLGRLDAALVEWRGQRVPLVSLEAMLNESLPTIGQRVRCAVLYGTNPEIALPYYAILLSGVPRSEELLADSFSEESFDAGGLWYRTAMLGGRRIAVPDIRQLETRIDEMRLRFERDMSHPSQSSS
jgi:chemosensory pili system protein ChpC